MKIRQGKPDIGGTITAWRDSDTDSGVLIRETMDRGRDVQTVYVTQQDLEKILANWDKL